MKKQLMSHSKEQVISFVREWEKASPGPDSFRAHCSKYPKEFEKVWMSCKDAKSWEDAEEKMIYELRTSRTKLGRALR